MLPMVLLPLADSYITFIHDRRLFRESGDHGGPASAVSLWSGDALHFKAKAPWP
jgi:hypothetical protein